MKPNVKPGRWIGVDLDGTLARDDSGAHFDESHIGEPIPKMVERVKKWIDDGIEVRILTARAGSKSAVQYIEKWCQEHIGHILPVTNEKDYDMAQLWDDRAVQVERNTGEEIFEIAWTHGFDTGFINGVDAHVKDHRKFNVCTPKEDTQTS